MSDRPKPDLHLVRVIPAPPTVVFEAWLAPTALKHFMCPAEGMTVGKVEVEARVGGAFLIEMIVGGESRPHTGEYTVIERHKRLAFTWRSHHAGEGSRVELTFAPMGADRTRLTLDHYGLGDAANIERHEAGWSAIVGALAEL